MSPPSESVCELCRRVVPRVTRHHLEPRQIGRRKGKKVVELPTAELCPPCHRQVHVLFENEQLARELDTIERLSEHPDMVKFLTWLRKQPASKGIRVRR